MIFTIGLVLLVAGALLCVYGVSQPSFRDYRPGLVNHWRDFTGAERTALAGFVLVIAGLALALLSICILAWRYMP